MASWIAGRITQMLVASSLIEEGDRELYIYGFFTLISHIYFFFVTAVTGFMMGILVESVVFYVVFMLLRTYAGGVHAKTEIACSVLTTLALIASLIGIKQLEALGSSSISLLMLGVGSLCVLLFSPLDTEEKPLDEQEKRKYRAICMAILFLCIMAAAIAQLLSIHGIFSTIICSVFLEGILLVAGKMSYMNTKKLA